jgi:aspartate kinase
VPDTPGIAARLFTAIAETGVNIDMIVQNVSGTEAGGGRGYTDITFTLARDDVRRITPVIETFKRESQAREVNIQEGIAKLSVVGIGMRSHSGVAARLFTALAEKGINIQMISTSEIKISVVIDESQADEAARAAHAKFELNVAPPVSN